MISAPDPTTQLGPLCTDPDPSIPEVANLKALVVAESGGITCGSLSVPRHLV